MGVEAANERLVSKMQCSSILVPFRVLSLVAFAAAPFAASASAHAAGLPLVRGLSSPAAPFVTPAVSGPTLLYNFQGGSSDGGYPYAPLIAGSSGRLYGTTNDGGPADQGTAFELNRSGPGYAERPLYAFKGGTTDGALPYGSLLLGKGGVLYGTTYSGGAFGAGCVFALTPSGSHYTESVVYSFEGSPNDGANPYAGLSEDAAGTLYGTTLYGGTFGAGTVFSLTQGANGVLESVLYSFSGSSDGATPYGAVLPSSGGVLYGTATFGGSENDGVVYALTPSGTTYVESVLHNFAGGTDGANPYSSLVEAANGDLFGTTVGGGSGNSGTVFRVDAAKKPYVEQVLYAFGASGSGDGTAPYGAPVLYRGGKLFGTTFGGGAYGAGTIYELSKRHKGFAETILASFTGFPAEANPYSGLFEKSGALYGTTFGGGYDGYGTVFSLKL